MKYEIKTNANHRVSFVLKLLGVDFVLTSKLEEHDIQNSGVASQLKSSFLCLAFLCQIILQKNRYSSHIIYGF